MNDLLKLGVVGLRNIGKGHVRRCLDLPHANVIAVADAREDRLAEACEEFGDVEGYADAANLIARDDLDGVVLAVPNHVHAPLSIVAMEAGKHVLVEKPISVTSSEAREMIAARDQNERVLMVGMNRRFSPKVYAIRKLLDSGEFGQVYYAKTRWNRRRLTDVLWERGDWFLSKKLSGGGPLIDLGVHMMDLVWHLMGAPDPASAAAVQFTGKGSREGKKLGRSYRMEDFIGGLIRFEDGRALHIESAFFSSEREEVTDLTLYGEYGGITMSGREWSVFRTEGEEVEDIDLPPDPEAPRSSVEHFVNVLTGKEDLSSTPEQGLQVMQMVEALYASADAGTCIYLG
ncbi:MAG: Gfo/Idh/MocA family oxidoreductase [Candidatus Latescibacteria bacterium]|nr:Gfo/Idh/MocA family oxidoreductase [Candidatus Latescibacterota bacterium]